MQKVSNTVLAVLVLLTLGACAPVAGGESGFPAPAASEDVHIRIQNNNWADVAVYVIRHGMRSRIGTVSSMSQEVFAVPRGLVPPGADVQLLVDPIGSRITYTTEPILVSPGQTIDMNVENNLRLTNWAVW
mgnify:FL=1